MNENRLQAVERLLRELDQFDIFAPPHKTAKGVIEEVASVMHPFLQNPEQHHKYVSLIIEYAIHMGMAHAFARLLKFYDIPFARGWFRRNFTEHLSKFQAKVRVAREELLSGVDPGELKIDLLPIASLATKADWKKQGKRLILLETRAVVLPGPGMQLRAVSHQLQVTKPSGCQFVDAFPSNEMETIGQREVSVSERGKFVYSTSTDEKLAGSVSGGPAKLQATLGDKESTTSEKEDSISEKLSHAPQVARVISSAVGDTAIWQLLRTPSQTLLGTNKFSATLLIPLNAEELELSLRYGADIEGWGPTGIQQIVHAQIPHSKA